MMYVLWRRTKRVNILKLWWPQNLTENYFFFKFIDFPTNANWFLSCKTTNYTTHTKSKQRYSSQSDSIVFFFFNDRPTTLFQQLFRHVALGLFLSTFPSRDADHVEMFLMQCVKDLTGINLIGVGPNGSYGSRDFRSYISHDATQQHLFLGDWTLLVYWVDCLLSKTFSV